MRFLIVNTDYDTFLRDLYQRNPGLEVRPFDEQMKVRNATLFSVSNFYSSAFKQLGHEAADVFANNQPAQKAWARDHGVPYVAKRPWTFRLRRGFVPWFGPAPDTAWFHEILRTQIERYRPDVLLNQAMAIVTPDFLRSVKPMIRCIVGQHAATQLRDDWDWSAYDLAVSSFPPTVDWFCRKGLRAELNRLAIDPRIATVIPPMPRDIPVSFVGSFAAVHSSRTAMLELLARRLPLQIWGEPPVGGFGNSPLKACYQGRAWGIDMFKILARSRITINHHGDVAPFANNFRLYEATVTGTLLVTDWKQNLHEMFDPATEVAAYRSNDECVERVRYYLDHEDERARIAAAGQQRTLQEHTLVNRMAELIETIKGLL